MKKQFKKSLSLFLAVLMMLSCWVWIAPQKAEAGAPNSYDVTVSGTVGNAVDNEAYMYIYYGNGVENKFDFKEVKSDGNFSKTFTVSGWPNRIRFYFTTNTLTKHDVSVKSITINGTVIFEDNYTISKSATSDGKSDENLYPNGSWGSWNFAEKGVWVEPYLYEISATLTGDSHTLDKVNTGKSVKSTIALSGALDQYGVKWTGAVDAKFSLRADGVSLTTKHASITAGSDNDATITIKPWIQTLFPGRQNAKLYVDWTATNGKGGSELINLDFPTYNATFNANGGSIGEDEHMIDDDGIIEFTHDRMNIGSVIGVAPSYAYKENFVFLGYYSKQNSDKIGKDANPVGTKFEDGETVVPHSTGAGNGYESDQDPFYGDTIWYAAWQAAPLDVTFITADNQRIATLTGRHNNYMTSSTMYGNRSGLNAAIKAGYTGAEDVVKFNGNNEPIYKDGATEFRFKGWRIVDADDKNLIGGDENTVITSNVTYQAVYERATSEKYTVTFKDYDGSVIEIKDGAGNTIPNDQYNYRDDVVVPTHDDVSEIAQDDVYWYEFIGWANDIGKNYYTVDEYNKDKDGAVITYVHKDSAEFTVKGNATYVPVYRMTKREYSVEYNYYLDDKVSESVTIEGFNWNDNPTMPETIKDNYTANGQRHFIIGWKVDNKGLTRTLDEILIEGNMSITAVYGNTIPAEYDINFYKLAKTENGVEYVLIPEISRKYAHNEKVPTPEVDAIIETEDSQYSRPQWKDIKRLAGGDADYYVEYTKKDFADVSYYNYDGSLIYKLDGKVGDGTKQYFIGDRIPAYSEAEPVKPEDEVGTYKFTGWKNSNGEAVVPGRGASFDGDVYLYAQFETVYKEYEVKFVDTDGTEISTGKYHYGDAIEIPADPSKDADVEYEYKFRDWSPEVMDICYGDATYTATYRKTPIYYTVTWLKDDKTVLSESNYKYNAKINQQNFESPVSYGQAEPGHEWALDYWVQCNANGQPINANGDIVEEKDAVIFERGMKMPAKALYFYPVFKQEVTTLTVKFFKEDGETYIGEVRNVPYNADIEDYCGQFEIKAPKISTDTHHFIINNWVDIETEEKVTILTKDVSVKATYTEEKHNKQISAVEVNPTCNVPGFAKYRCAAEECTLLEELVAIEPIPDTSAPSGQIYVGDTKWTLQDFQHGINYNIENPVGPKTTLIVNAEDSGSRSKPWNLEGELSRGVGKIEYYVSISDISNPATIRDWTEIYNYESLRQDALKAVLEKNKLTLVDYTGFNFGDIEAKKQKAAIDREVDAMLAGSKANATGVVSNLGLKEDKSYVIYIKITEREGNGEPNVTYISSGTINYGTKAPSISVTGEGYGAKFCNDVVIKVTDNKDGVKAYVDGEPITLEADGTYRYDVVGLHTIEAVDIHGNKTVKTFEIKGGHTYRNCVVAETCENEGLRYDLCIDCGSKDNEEVVPAIGHKFADNYVEKAPDCKNDGCRTYTCLNNCGTKITVYPTDSAEELAKVGITADDIKDLKATGEHTYAKVKDEDGNDTDEYVWVIDKAANCKVEGSKHRDCTVCGKEEARVTEVIEKDNENGHNFYRVKVTLEPTCTEKGKKTKTCKYCGKVELVEYIDALGHTAGEYRVITAATCVAKGSKILKCSECGVDIGEPIEDADGKITGFDGKEVEIKELGHAWNLDGEIYQDTDGKWYQNYKCGNDENHKDKKEVAGYVPPVSATVTFDYNGGYYSVPAVGNPNEFGYIPEMIKGTQSLSKFVGETIIETDIAKPIKAADTTKRYTFSHWVDAEGKEVKFPIEVNGDATYYAVFAEKYINYTITYYKEIEKVVGEETVTELEEFKKTGYLHNGEEVTLAAGPSKAETNLDKYVFAGWKVKDSNPAVIYTDKVTIEGASINLVATYTEVDKQYAVTYAYSSSNQIHTYTVDAGFAAPDVRDDFEITKAFDTKYHYEFKEWNRKEQLKKVESNIYTTPNFTAIDHTYTHQNGKVLKAEATCTSKAVYTYTCTCGYTYEKEEGTVLGHNWGTPNYDVNTGKTTVTCQNEGCGATEEDTRTFTVKFYINETDEKAIKTVSYLSWGTKLTAIQLPADPTKEGTNENTYKFKGWAVKGTKDVVDVTSIAVKEDAEYVAIFEATVREYTVTFAYDAYNVIKVITGVKAGTSVTYSGATPTKAFDDNYHYSFKGWSGSTSNILKDTYVTAQFDRTAHDNTPSITAATCTAGEGTVYTCTCGYKSPVVATSKPLGHNYAEVIDTKVLPKDGKDGSVTMKCSRCGDTYVKVLPWTEDDTPTTPETPETPDKVTIRITVRDQRGNGISGATVALYQNSNWVAQDITNSDGVVAFVVAPGKYTAVFTGVKYSGDEQTEITVNNDGSISGNIPQMYINNCGCACHRDNLWGKIFRFFHSIIKTLTGEFKCCKDPSDLY